MARFGNRERKKRPGQSSTRPMSRLPSRTDTVMGRPTKWLLTPRGNSAVSTAWCRGYWPPWMLTSLASAPRQNTDRMPRSRAGKVTVPPHTAVYRSPWPYSQP